jgi:hypothetical protein
MKEENWTIEYTYQQLPIQKAATRPGSILNRQGGSIFNRREHQGSKMAISVMLVAHSVKTFTMCFLTLQ